MFSVRKITMCNVVSEKRKLIDHNYFSQLASEIQTKVSHKSVVFIGNKCAANDERNLLAIAKFLITYLIRLCTEIKLSQF